MYVIMRVFGRFSTERSKIVETTGRVVEHIAVGIQLSSDPSEKKLKN